MYTLRTIILLIIIVAIVSIAAPLRAEETFAPAQTLMDCYRLALKRSESIAIDAERINETRAHFLQALSGLLPQVSFESDNFRVKTYNPQYFAQRNTFERKFVFSQTIFSGFKEFAAIRGSGYERKEYESALRRAQQLLFTDVSDAFYFLLEQRESLAVLQSEKNVLRDRIKELQDRERIGRSRRSEIVNTEVLYYNTAAAIESAKAQEVVARHLLEFLTGMPVGEIADPDTEFPALAAEVFYLSRASGRPDVLASEFAWLLSQKESYIALTGFFPTVSVQANYYTSRTVAPQDSRWDATLKVAVPIFEGTQTLGNVQLANTVERENKLQLSQVRRQAMQDVRDAYSQCEASAAQEKALEKALRAARLNFALQRKDYQHNLVNNLDVLLAIQSLQDSQRNYIGAFYDVKRRYWQLRVAAGELNLDK